MTHQKRMAAFTKQLEECSASDMWIPAQSLLAELEAEVLRLRARVARLEKSATKGKRRPRKATGGA